MIEKFLDRGVHFYYFCGGRGIGKTYGALHECYEIGTGKKAYGGEKGKFLYLRRTGVEAASIASPEACPFKRYNSDEGTDVWADFSAKLGYGSFFCHKEAPMHIGYCAALSTFSNLRGVDFSDVSLILFDECIPENRSKAPLPNEGLLFLNMVETVNRNRALLNRPEVVSIMLSNPIDLSSPLLTQLKFTPILTSMIFKRQEKYTDYARSLHIESYKDHAVSKLKGEKSALYKFSKGTGFNEEALTGDFVHNDMSVIKDLPLSEYKPLAIVGSICMYVHKNAQIVYLSQKLTPCNFRLSVGEREKIRATVYWKYKYALTYGQVFYDSYETKVVFDNIVGYRAAVN